MRASFRWGYGVEGGATTENLTLQRAQGQNDGIEAPWCGGSVAGDRGVDVAGPLVDAAGEGLGVVEALVAQPHGNGEGSRAMVAEDYDMRVGVEFGVGARGDFAHGYEQGIRQAGGLKLPGLADVEQDWGFGRGTSRLSGAKSGEGLGSDLGIGQVERRRGHASRISLQSAFPEAGPAYSGQPICILRDIWPRLPPSYL
jgi:hypothetical protein